MVFKFVEHFFWIAAAMNRSGADGMWDEEDGFYYDVLRLPDGSATRLKVRSMVGLLPLCAATVIEQVAARARSEDDERDPGTAAPDARAVGDDAPDRTGALGVAGRGVLALVNPERLRRMLTKMLDENEFLSPYGIRSLSRFHAATIRTSSTSAARSTASTTCRPNRTPACSAATRTGAARSGCRSTR